MYDKWFLFQKFIEYLVNTANKSRYLRASNEIVEEVFLSYPYRCNAIYAAKMKQVVLSGTYYDREGNRYHVKVGGAQEEPVAIALNQFVMDEKFNDKSVLVFDMGSGTTDLAIVQNRNGEYEVLAHDGVSEAGSYIDDLIIKELLKKARKSTGLLKRGTPVSEEEFFAPSNTMLDKVRSDIRDIKEMIEETGDAPAELWLKDEKILACDITFEEYAELISPFIKEMIMRCKALMEKHEVEYIVLAGGGSNCKLLQEMFIKEFGIKRVVSTMSMRDRRTATALGNAYRIQLKKSVQNLLNFSYGVRCYDPKDGRHYIHVFFHRDEKLPIIDKECDYFTNSETEYVVDKYYVGTEKDITISREYNLGKYEQMTGKDFVYHFGHVVPRHTSMKTYYSMDENGVMTIRVESEDAYVSSQTHMITELQ